MPMSSPAALSMLQHAASDIKPTRSSHTPVVVVGIEVGGRFGTETVARHRAESVPAPPDRPLSPPGLRAGPHFWPSQRALAASLLEFPPAEGLGDGPVPDLHD